MYSHNNIYGYDKDEITGCKPAASVLNVAKVDCEECPFPFCVVEEASVIEAEIREYMIKTLRRLGKTVDEVAQALQISRRSIFRHTSSHENVNAYENPDCIWCNALHSPEIVCKSNLYSVLRNGDVDDQYTIILNKHRHASGRELKIIELFAGYAFPSSVIGVERSGNGHDHWILERVKLEESKNFMCMCDALNTYMRNRSSEGGLECQLPIR